MKSPRRQFWSDLKSGVFVSMVKESARGESLNNPREVYNTLKPLFAENDDVECLYGIFLNSKNRILAIEKLSAGSISSAVLYPREVIKMVLRHKAAAMVLAHNHPSGNFLPSPEDRALTNRIYAALKTIDVDLLDHIIVADGFYSFADEGLLETIKAHHNNHIKTGGV